MRNVLIFAIVLIVSLGLKAQDQIEGEVLELAKDGKKIPVFGANVYWEETQVGTTTDINGVYLINAATSFPATLTVSYIGYTFDSKEIIDNKYIFYLTRSVALDEIEVSSRQNTTKISLIESLNVQTLSSGEIQKAACCNLSECFETNNTVDVAYSNAVSGIKKIKMLGLDGNYVQITSELIPLIRGLQRSYGLNYIPGSWIESIQIIKGIGSVVNGYEALTGQINIEYFKPESDNFNWNIYANNSGKLETNLALARKKGNWGSNLFTHLSYFDREIDHHGNYHDHTDHTDHLGDKFLDMPKFKQFSFLNRWKYYGSDEYRMQFNFRALIEDRRSGQLTDKVLIPDPYLVNIDNKLVQLYAKLGRIIDANRSVGSQASLTVHDQAAQFGDNIYNGLQQSVSLNIVSQNQINEANLFKYGFSYFADRFIESFNGNIIRPIDSKERVDLVAGLFSEYQYSNEKINVLSGLRADYYNIEDKIYYSPRLNIKYNPADRIAIRFSSGSAFRISNIFADNMQYLASSRHIVIGDDLTPEVAWNYGLNLAYCFYLLENEGTLSFDVYRTVFENQIVIDIEDKDMLSFYNLNGASYSNTLQIDVDYSILSNLNMRLSYKKNNTISTFDGVERALPLQPYDRALVNFTYENIIERWFFDITANYTGKSRIPENIINKESFSPSFVLLNSQLTYKWKGNDVYAGVENISNYTQPNPIIDPENPFEDNFDASLIWAPVMGRTFYLGIRYKIN
tara:strand:+ start:36871 stop:39093 length:2223 start_codon:yes stop_codon:yes gene_type:complete